jgi:hypothetical protein
MVPMVAAQVALVPLIPPAADLCSPWPPLQSCTTICQHHPQSVYYSKKKNRLHIHDDRVYRHNPPTRPSSTWRPSCQGSEAPREHGQWGVGGGNRGQDPARRRTHLIAAASPRRRVQPACRAVDWTPSCPQITQLVRRRFAAPRCAELPPNQPARCAVTLLLPKSTWTIAAEWIGFEEREPNMGYEKADLQLGLMMGYRLGYKFSMNGVK